MAQVLKRKKGMCAIYVYWRVYQDFCHHLEQFPGTATDFLQYLLQGYEQKSSQGRFLDCREALGLDSTPPPPADASPPKNP